MIQEILQALYLFLPAYVANMTPVIIKGYFKGLAKPLDGGMRLRGKPLFGAHKTWRGLIFGVLVGTLICFLQYLVAGEMAYLTSVDYSDWFIIGLLLSFGALFGDSLESLAKRQIAIKPGKPWIPFDQLDFVVGGLLFYSLYKVPSVEFVAVIVFFSFFLHMATNHVGYYLKIRKEKW